MYSYNKDIKESNCNNITENRSKEQYFFSKNMVNNIVNSFDFVDKHKILCLCTPIVALGFKENSDNSNFNIENNINDIDNHVFCIDIDIRFNNKLNNFYSFDILEADKFIQENNYLKNYLKNDLEYIILDPPFFQIKLCDLRKAVDIITNFNYKIKLMISFVSREEKNLLFAFKSYNLCRTKLNVEYENVCPSKWDNYSIYSNFEQGKIKFVNKSKNN